MVNLTQKPFSETTKYKQNRLNATKKGPSFTHQTSANSLSKISDIVDKKLITPHSHSIKPQAPTKPHKTAQGPLGPPEEYLATVSQLTSEPWPVRFWIRFWLFSGRPSGIWVYRFPVLSSGRISRSIPWLITKSTTAMGRGLTYTFWSWWCGRIRS